MKNLQFSTTIKAPKEKVWKTLWNDDTYRRWTSVFHEGSYAKSNWNEGDEIYFLGPEGGGMYSVIDRLVPNEHMSFKHLGVVKDGINQPMDEETKQWSGAMEKYALQSEGENTLLNVQLDTVDDHEKYFSEKFPEALAKVKEIAEG